MKPLHRRRQLLVLQLVVLYAIFVTESVDTRNLPEPLPSPLDFVLLQWNSTNSTTSSAPSNPVFFFLLPTLNPLTTDTTTRLPFPSFTNTADQDLTRSTSAGINIDNSKNHLATPFSLTSANSHDAGADIDHSLAYLPPSTTLAAAAPARSDAKSNLDANLTRVATTSTTNTNNTEDSKEAQVPIQQLTNNNHLEEEHYFKTHSQTTFIPTAKVMDNETNKENISSEEAADSEQHQVGSIVGNNVGSNDFEPATTFPPNSSRGGIFGSSWKRLFSNKRKRMESSSSSSSGRSGSSFASFLSTRSKRVDKTWFPVSVDESLTNEAWPRNEACVVFEAGAESLKNINKAELALKVEQPTDGRLMAYVLYGKYETFNISVKSRKKLTESEITLLDVQHSPREQDSLIFDVTGFIQDIVGNFDKIGLINISYFIRRQTDFHSNNILMAIESTAVNHHPILSLSTFDPPYFKVYYNQQ